MCEGTPDSGSLEVLMGRRVAATHRGLALRRQPDGNNTSMGEHYGKCDVQYSHEMVAE